MATSFTFANPYAPSVDRLTPTDLAQLRRIIGLQRGVPSYDGPVPPDELIDTARYEVLADGQHRYDAWVVNGCVPVVVFKRGGAEVLAWWSDQDDWTEAFGDADAVWAACEARPTQSTAR